MKTPFAWPHGHRAAVTFTFDDARVSQVDYGLPVLNRYGVKATFYLLPKLVPERLEAWQQAAQAGHEMGNHTMTHPCSGQLKWSRNNALEDYSLARIEQEIRDANTYIHQTFGVPARTFAYPCSHSDVGRGVNRASYVPLIARDFIVGRGASSRNIADPTYCDLATVSTVIGDNVPFANLQPLLQEAAETGGWLVFVSHDVEDKPHQAMSPGVLEELCRYCTNPAQNFWVDTAAAVGAHVRNWQSAHQP
jgi:peptidoglycan/xylan/chitin deacetylase (PgdA/CDA1 family)